MNTKFSWILVALLLSSFVCWSSTFAPGQHNPKMRYGKRHFVPQSNRANVSWLIAMHVESFLQELFFTFKIIFFPLIYMERSALFSFFFSLLVFSFHICLHYRNTSLEQGWKSPLKILQKSSSRHGLNEARHRAEFSNQLSSLKN